MGSEMCIRDRGSFVPAEKAIIGISDRIFSRVGSGDDLSRGQSTFMVEMIETASILNHATEKSFVILDEIGRGTSTWDGLSLAWSIIEKLHNDINCKTLFATHYHELTTLERSLKKLSLKTLEAKEYNDGIIFLYNLVNGSSKSKYPPSLNALVINLAYNKCIVACSDPPI